MIEVEPNKKEEILSIFPFLCTKLSYENIVHKKVLNSHLVSIIPLGKKCLIWFTLSFDQPICYVLKLELNKDQKDINISKKNVSNVYILTNYSFDFTLCYGTILYGTMFHYLNQGFFSIEDIYFNQGTNIFHEEFHKKLVIIKRILDKKINASSNKIQKSSLTIGLPLLSTNLEELMEKIKILPYKIYCLLFRKDNLIFKMPFYNLNMNLSSGIKLLDKQFDKNKNSSCIKNIPLDKFNLKKEIILKIRPDIQNDIYHLFCLDDKEIEYYIDVAYIPDYKTSVFMNSLFRNIKENNNLDYLEESDEEDEFENEKEDRFVNLDKEILMFCKYHYKFKKWVPIKEIISNRLVKPIYYNDFVNLAENKR